MYHTIQALEREWYTIPYCVLCHLVQCKRVSRKLASIQRRGSPFLAAKQGDICEVTRHTSLYKVANIGKSDFVGMK